MFFVNQSQLSYNALPVKYGFWRLLSSSLCPKQQSIFFGKGPDVTISKWSRSGALRENNRVLKIVTLFAFTEHTLHMQQKT
jgi:hypothetical protein